MYTDEILDRNTARAHKRELESFNRAQSGVSILRDAAARDTTKTVVTYKTKRVPRRDLVTVTEAQAELDRVFAALVLKQSRAGYEGVAGRYFAGYDPKVMLAARGLQCLK